MTLKDIPSAISSPELVDGPTPCNLQTGQQTDLFGQEVVLASRSARRENEKVRKMKDICGPSGLNLSEPIPPPSLWENKLMQRLAMGGSMECILTWKARVTPSGRRLFQLVPSTRLIEEIDYGLWRTPTADGLGQDTAATARGKSVNLAGQATAALWPTPNANKHRKNSKDPERMKEGGVQTCLADAVHISIKALWATPVAHEARLGYQHRHDNAKGTQKSLTTEAVDALGLGANVNGLPERTEKRGGLNPAFPCWLMGFPQEWLNYAPLETRLSRKSPPK